MNFSLMVRERRNELDEVISLRDRELRFSNFVLRTSKGRASSVLHLRTSHFALLVCHSRPDWESMLTPITEGRQREVLSIRVSNRMPCDLSTAYYAALLLSKKSLFPLNLQSSVALSFYFFYAEFQNITCQR